MNRMLLNCSFALVAAVMAFASARGASTGAAMVLVATQSGSETVGEAVVLAVPLADGRHFGFVLNQPTQTTLASLFPDEEASRKVQAPVFVGGSSYTEGVFAVVRESAGERATPRRITPELSIALHNDDVDQVIAQRAASARFFVGMTVWDPGELETQLEGGAWQVVPPDADVVMCGNPALLWTRLAERSRYHNAVHVDGVPGKPDPKSFPRGFPMRRG